MTERYTVNLFCGKGFRLLICMEVMNTIRELNSLLRTWSIVLICVLLLLLSKIYTLKFVDTCPLWLVGNQLVEEVKEGKWRWFYGWWV